jgi:hypothetical protein
MKRVRIVTTIVCLSFLACMAGCSSTPPEVLSPHLNQAAELIGNIPANPFDWRVITSFADRSASTMSTLYGNDVATVYARAHTQQDYPVGAVICVVTWTQREDLRWYGAQIPNQVQSIEFVTVRAQQKGAPSYMYEKYEGSPLAKVADQDSPKPSDREAFLLSLRAAVMP